jgi:4-hydroxybenzoate polyprenyltransferase
MEDDVKAGVKSTALLFGRKWMKPILSIFACIAIVGWAIAGYQNGQGLAFYTISVMGSALHIAWQLATVRIDSPEDCGSKFAVRIAFPLGFRMSS